MNSPASPAASAAIYVRRSHADAAGSARNGRSLGEQEKECRDLAARMGLQVVAVYRECEGTGASRRSLKKRPEWIAALADLDAGTTFQTLIVWALDRADRRGADELGRLLTRHSETGRRILGVDGTDTSDERRRIEHIIRAEMARDEAERIAERVGRAKRHARAEGRWLGGPPPYGTRVEDGHIAHDPETFPIARRIADDLLAGGSLWAAVKRLNDEGLPAPRGGKWAVGTVAHMVRSPGWAGLQSIRGRTASGHWKSIAEVFLGEDGLPVVIGTGVISPGERARILAAIDHRAQTTCYARKDGAPARRGRRAVSSLLGDVLRCTCGARVAISGTTRHKSYRCGGMANGKPCPGFTVPVVGTDDAVSLAFLVRLSTLDPGDPLLETVADAWVARVEPDAVAARQAAQDALDAARADLARVRRLVAAGTFDEDDAADVMPRLRDAVKAAETRLAAIPLPEADISPLLDIAQSWEAWELLPVAEARALLALAIDHVAATRSTRGRGYRFNPGERLTITWADGSTSRPGA